MSEVWTAVGSIGTAIAVIVAAIQIRYATRQEKTEFEDSLAKEYRELLGQLSRSILLQDTVTDRDTNEKFVILYRYLDLSNEQVLLREKGRITKVTWNDWCAGIRSNLEKDGFKDVWNSVKGKSFDDLKRLQDTDFVDPRRPWYVRLFSR